VKTRLACLLPVLLLSGCAVATTQLSVGSPVRMRLYASAAAGDRVAGSLVGLSAESVSVRRDSSGDVVGVPRFRVAALEVRRRGTAQWLGAVLGATAGGIGATLVTAQQERNCRREIGDFCGLFFGLHLLTSVYYYAVGIGAGGGLGFFLGHQIPVTNWRPVPLDDLHVTVTPLAGGRLGVGVAIGLR
jgi:hypothetical protein